MEELHEANEGKASNHKENDNGRCCMPDEPVLAFEKFEETKNEETEGDKDQHRTLDEPVLKRAKPYVAVNGDESSNGKKEDDGPCGTTNELVLQSAKAYVPVAEELDEAKDEESSEQQEGVIGHCSTHDEPVLKRAKPYLPAAFDKMDDKGEESPEGKVDDYCSTPEHGTSPSDAANSEMTCSMLPVDASTYDKETPVHQEEATPETADPDTPSFAQQEKASPETADPDTPPSAQQEKATPETADPDTPPCAQQEKATPETADPDTPSFAQQEKASPETADPDTPPSAQQEKATPETADPDTPSFAQQEKASPETADPDTPPSPQQEKATPETADPHIPSSVQQEKATPEKADPDTLSSGNMAGSGHVPGIGFIEASVPVDENQHENDKVIILLLLHREIKTIILFKFSTNDVLLENTDSLNFYFSNLSIFRRKTEKLFPLPQTNTSIFS